MRTNNVQWQYRNWTLGRWAEDIKYINIKSDADDGKQRPFLPVVFLVRRAHEAYLLMLAFRVRQTVRAERQVIAGGEKYCR